MKEEREVEDLIGDRRESAIDIYIKSKKRFLFRLFFFFFLGIRYKDRMKKLTQEEGTLDRN